ncbi:MAG: hypothetical protein ABJA82_08925 [Myxococcales bacterium]
MTQSLDGTEAPTDHLLAKPDLPHAADAQTAHERIAADDRSIGGTPVAANAASGGDRGRRHATF